jgi:hypothetical protein
MLRAVKERAMTKTEALEAAKRVATENDWPWLEPVVVTKKRRWFRVRSWMVHSNADERGCNVRVEVDDAAGRVVRAVFCPR